jgi:hypothetical protein
VATLAPEAENLVEPPASAEEKASRERARHWDDTYTRVGAGGASWHQETPTMSLDLIDILPVSPDDPVIDVGGGASLLADHLLARFTDLTVLDLSNIALDQAGRRLGNAALVTRIHEDVLLWRPQRRYAVWHDRAVFHFLVNPEDRTRYLSTLRAALRDNGCVILATFAPDGPDSCSGLPVARYSAPDLSRLLGTSFELLATLSEQHFTPRGSRQPFTWIAGRMRTT